MRAPRNLLVLAAAAALLAGCSGTATGGSDSTGTATSTAATSTASTPTASTFAATSAADGSASGSATDGAASGDEQMDRLIASIERQDGASASLDADALAIDFAYPDSGVAALDATQAQFVTLQMLTRVANFGVDVASIHITSTTASGTTALDATYPGDVDPSTLTAQDVWDAAEQITLAPEVEAALAS